jgi:membrane-associated protein
MALSIPRIRLIYLIPILIALSLSELYLANKSWRTFQVLSSARELGISEGAGLRAYMTIAELQSQFELDGAAFELIFGSVDLAVTETIKSIAVTQGRSELELIAAIQGQLVSRTNSTTATEEPSLLTKLSDYLLELMSQYGVIVLVLVVFLGSLGAPVPAGPMAAMTGVFAFSGGLSALPTALAILFGSVAGDMLIYSIGRRTDPARLVKIGRWVGYTEANRVRLERLFERFGDLTLLLTRSLVAHISAVASLLAGSSGISVTRFLIYTCCGRTLWLLIYFGAGYLVGSDFTMASSFLSYLSLLLIALAASITLIFSYFKKA